MHTDRQPFSVKAYRKGNPGHYTYLGLNILQTGYGARAKKDAD